MLDRFITSCDNYYSKCKGLNSNGCTLARELHNKAESSRKARAIWTLRVFLREACVQALPYINTRVSVGKSQLADLTWCLCSSSLIQLPLFKSSPRDFLASRKERSFESRNERREDISPFKEIRQVYCASILFLWERSTKINIYKTKKIQKDRSIKQRKIQEQESLRFLKAW